MSDDIEARNLSDHIKALTGGPNASEADVVRLIDVTLREARRCARSAALEEAARVADIEASTDKYATDSQAHRIAAAIRELKAR